MIIYAIDPGPTESAFVYYDALSKKVIEGSNGIPNEQLMTQTPWCDVYVCEGIQSYGMAVGRTTFDTAYMVGRLWQLAVSTNNPFSIVYNPEVRTHLCHTRRAKDSNVRRALLDRFERTGGGANPEIGTKKEPGPLYGYSGNHFWSALACAIYYAETRV